MPNRSEDISGFMQRQRMATFCTVMSDGAPHAVPVWFTYAAGKAYVHTDRNTVKVRNIEKNPRVCIAVYDDNEAVILHGTAVILGEHEFKTRTEQHIRKYQLRLDETGHDSLGIPVFDFQVRCVLEITAEKTLYW